MRCFPLPSPSGESARLTPCPSSVVEFSSPDEAQKAIRELNDQTLLGRPLFIREVRCPLPSSPLFDSRHRSSRIAKTTRATVPLLSLAALATWALEPSLALHEAVSAEALGLAAASAVALAEDSVAALPAEAGTFSFKACVPVLLLRITPFSQPPISCYSSRSTSDGRTSRISSALPAPSFAPTPRSTPTARRAVPELSCTRRPRTLRTPSVRPFPSHSSSSSLPNPRLASTAMYNGFEFQGNILEVREDRFTPGGGGRGGFGGGFAARGGFGGGFAPRGGFGGGRGGFGAPGFGGADMYGAGADYSAQMDPAAFGFQGFPGAGRGGFGGAQFAPRGGYNPAAAAFMGAAAVTAPSTQIFVKNVRPFLVLRPLSLVLFALLMRSLVGSSRGRPATRTSSSCSRRPEPSRRPKSCSRTAGPKGRVLSSSAPSRRPRPLSPSSSRTATEVRPSFPSSLSWDLY